MHTLLFYTTLNEFRITHSVRTGVLHAKTGPAVHINIHGAIVFVFSPRHNTRVVGDDGQWNGRARAMRLRGRQ